MLGWQREPLRAPWNGRKEPFSKLGAQLHLPFFPKDPLDPGLGPRVSARKQSPDSEAPAFIIKASRSRVDGREETATEKDLKGPFPPGCGVPRLPLVRGGSLNLLPFVNLGPYIISLTQVSLKYQAKPDPRAESAGRDNAQSSDRPPGAPGASSPVWVGSPEYPSSIEAQVLGAYRGGTSPQEFGEDNITKERLTLVPVGWITH